MNGNARQTLDIQGWFERFSQYRKELMGFAAIWVGLLHSFPELFSTVRLPVLTRLMNRGNLGVDIFLILSGIGLFHSMNQDGNIMHFYKKRMVRVVIPWLTLSAPYWVFRGVHTGQLSIGYFMRNWTGLSFFLEGTTTTWYVEFILLAYLVYPLVFGLQKKAPEAILLLGTADVVLNIALFLYAEPLYDRFEIALTRVPVFLAGSYLGGSMMPAKGKASLVRLNLVLLYGAAGTVLFLSRNWVGAFHSGLWVMSYRYGGGGFVLILMLLACLVFQRCRAQFLQSGLRFFGEMSLEFYLVNVFLRNACSMLGFGGGTLRKLTISSIVFLLSAVTARFAVKRLPRTPDKRLNMRWEA